MLPAKGMEPVIGMDIEKVNAKLRSYLGKLRGEKDFWKVLLLGKRLAAGVEIESWRDTWARRLLIYMRSPEIIGSHIDEGDCEAARERAVNYEEF